MKIIYEELKERLAASPRTWLITGVAGFIGSNILETLLELNQKVVGLDNFSTGFKHNLDEVERLVGEKAWQNFAFHEGDICNIHDCRTTCRRVDYVLHQAALGSVPRSIEDPIITNQANNDGFLNMLVAARDEGVKRLVYAGSSSTYGDHQTLPKVENVIGDPLSPYAVTKYVNELYASVFARCYGFESIGLRYFNVFGQRQDPEGPYAAVIPKWFSAMLRDEVVYINGDGETSRDFCHIDNVIQANILAATTPTKKALNRVYNIACSSRMTLNELFQLIKDQVEKRKPGTDKIILEYRKSRPGDVRHSLADISLAKSVLGYEPQYSVIEGLEKSADWYTNKFSHHPKQQIA